VRGIILSSLGVGSTIEKILDPYGRGMRRIVGTTTSLGRRFLKRQRSYPGLAEAFGTFYRHIQGGPAPYPPRSILRTVELCALAQERLEAAERAAQTTPEPTTPPTVAVTGGTGLLGRRVVRLLRDRGVTPLAISRRRPTAASREPGVHYLAADLGAPGGLMLPATIRSVIHCAAETAGSWDAHQRNSIDATRHVMEAMRAAGAKELVNVSSLAVLDADARQPLSEASPVEHAPRRRGAYVWGKLSAERLAIADGPGMGIAVKTVRPGALVDRADYNPPGKLGRQIGRWFVAFDSPRATIPISDLDRVAEVLAWTASHFGDAPDLLHAIEPEPVTRRALVQRVRASRPGTRVVWIYRPILRVLSMGMILLQRIIRPTRTPVSLWTVFQAPRCDTTAMRRVVAAMTPVAEVGAGGG